MSSDLNDKSCRIRPKTKPTVAVIGASSDSDKPSYKAVKGFADAGFDVYPVNPNAAEVAGHKCFESLACLPVDKLDRVALFVPGKIGMDVLDELAHHSVGEIWASPGADDPAVMNKGRKMGFAIFPICSLDMLGVKV